MTLILYGVASLKEKRSVVRRVSHRIRSKFNAAVAEVDDMDAHDHAVIGAVVVGNEKRFIERSLQNIENFTEQLGLAELSFSQRAIEKY